MSEVRILASAGGVQSFFCVDQSDKLMANCSGTISPSRCSNAFRASELISSRYVNCVDIDIDGSASAERITPESKSKFRSETGRKVMPKPLAANSMHS